jgi:hypothetical protein
VSLIDYLGSPYDNGALPLIPGVTMACNPNDPDEMVGAIARERKILERRTEHAVRDRNAKFPVRLIIIDELNQFADIVAEHHNALRAADRALPAAEREGLGADAQVWADIRTLLRTGRFVNMHLLVVSQDFRDDAFGGKGARNYLGFKGMAGFNPSQWKKFIGTTPVPRPQPQKGRWIFTEGHTETWVQVTFADAENSRQCYDYAMEGRQAWRPEESVRTAALASLTPSLDRPGTDGHGADVLDMESHRTPQRTVITGRQAAADFLGMNLSQFEKARQRSTHNGVKNMLPGEFRVGGGPGQPAWYADDLKTWDANRPGKRRRNSGK